MLAAARAGVPTRGALFETASGFPATATIGFALIVWSGKGVKPVGIDIGALAPVAGLCLFTSKLERSPGIAAGERAAKVSSNLLGDTVLVRTVCSGGCNSDVLAMSPEIIGSTLSGETSSGDLPPSPMSPGARLPAGLAGASAIVAIAASTTSPVRIGTALHWAIGRHAATISFTRAGNPLEQCTILATASSVTSVTTPPERANSKATKSRASAPANGLRATCSAMLTIMRHSSRHGRLQKSPSPTRIN
jgi:hypothetical protein